MVTVMHVFMDLSVLIFAHYSPFTRPVNEMYANAPHDSSDGGINCNALWSCPRSVISGVNRLNLRTLMYLSSVHCSIRSHSNHFLSHKLHI